MSKKKPSKIKCVHCERTRLAKFIEWHPGIEEWQCKDFSDCDQHSSQLKKDRLEILGRLRKEFATGWFTFRDAKLTREVINSMVKEGCLETGKAVACSTVNYRIRRWYLV